MKGRPSLKGQEEIVTGYTASLSVKGWGIGGLPVDDLYYVRRDSPAAPRGRDKQVRRRRDEGTVFDATSAAAAAAAAFCQLFVVP